MESVHHIPQDSTVKQDGENGLLLLSRFQSDTLTLYQGKEATLSSQIGLAFEVPDTKTGKNVLRSFNAQDAARDSQNRIWIVGYEENSVWVIAPDGKAIINKFALPNEAKDADNSAEWAIIQPLPENTMLLLGQRTDRGNSWTPAAEGAFALLDEAGNILKKGNVPVSNPGIVVDFPDDGKNFSIFGHGALTASLPVSGGVVDWAVGPRAFSKGAPLQQNKRYTDADRTSDGRRVTLEWSPTENRSCVRVDARDLVCASAPGGYTFSHVIVSGQVVFATYVEKGQSQLWAMRLDGSETVKYSLPKGVPSLCHGP
jgi:hypothetical protein